MATSWQYDVATATYSSNGRALSQSQLRDVRDAVADGMIADVAAIVADWVAGKLTLAQWAAAFAEMIASSVIAGYLLGYGGTALLDDNADLDILALIAAQYLYAEAFAQDIADAINRGEPMSEAAMRARAELYAGASINAYEQANAAAQGASLPYYPADGQTECGARCRCWWSYEHGDGTTDAYWHTQEDNAVCPGCLEREAESDPYTLTPMIDADRSDPRFRLSPLGKRRVPLLKTQPGWEMRYAPPLEGQ